MAMLQGEPGADKLRDLQPDAVVNAVNAAEALAKLVSRGVPAAEAQAAYDALHLETTPFDAYGLRSRPVTFIRRPRWEAGASWRRLICTDRDGLRVAIAVCDSEAGFRH